MTWVFSCARCWVVGGYFLVVCYCCMGYYTLEGQRTSSHAIVQVNCSGQLKLNVEITLICAVVGYQIYI